MQVIRGSDVLKNIETLMKIPKMRNKKISRNQSGLSKPKIVSIFGFDKTFIAMFF